MADARVNPAMLAWARRRAGVSFADLSARSKQAWVSRVPDWEAGRSAPTFEQARQLANWLAVPLGYLFLYAPPSEDVDVPDLRTVGDKRGALSIDLAEVVMDAQRKQAWLRDYRRETGGERIAFVGRSSIADDPRAVAATLATALGLTQEVYSGAASWEEYLRVLTSLAEAAGVIVLQSGQVGNNTRRLLDPTDFRGFALADDLAPLVFLNTQDVGPARIFTLIHELAHLTVGVSGISNVPLETFESHGRAEETFCNKVAAEFLVPEAVFPNHWRADWSLEENARALARLFRVSQMVVARRALDLGATSPAEYWPFIQKCIAAAKAKKEKAAEAEGGPGFFRMVKLRNGAVFTSTVVWAVRSGHLLYRDGARLLGVKPEHLDRLA